jgi:hypothetical protein
MKIFNIALVLAIAVVALLVPFPLSAHEQVGACSLNVTNRCQIKSVIVAQADCRDLCTQHLMECRAVRGPNDPVRGWPLPRLRWGAVNPETGF